MYQLRDTCTVHQTSQNCTPAQLLLYTGPATPLLQPSHIQYMRPPPQPNLHTRPTSVKQPCYTSPLAQPHLYISPATSEHQPNDACTLAQPHQYTTQPHLYMCLATPVNQPNHTCTPLSVTRPATHVYQSSSTITRSPPHQYISPATAVH